MGKDVYALVTVNSQYCNYLRMFDDRVCYNSGEKELRPFVGILLEINHCKYFAPLSSPKPKHLKMKNQIDFYKIDEGKLGAINFNNMIPIPDNEYEYIDTNIPCVSRVEKQYQSLLKDQLRWINRESNGLSEKALNLYLKRTQNKLSERVAKRCCDFQLLEDKCKEYEREIEHMKTL